ncbi:MAG TPA: pyridoxal kinase [Paracoccaceae bacterium]|nr:pyridoxal kinase [Paracoccaceae bacterium]
MPAKPLPTLPLIVSVQSQVAFGHVGNSAAAYPMRACGVEVIEVPTTILSNNPHYATMRGTLLTGELVGDVLTGLGERGIVARTPLILSGFLGRAETAQALARFIRAAKAENPAIRYVCDPVMGDADLGYFADEALRAAFAEELVPLADVILPNAFELGTLTGFAIDGPEDVPRARAALGRKAVVATSVTRPDRPDFLATVTAVETGCTVLETRRLPVRPAGTGDLLSGLTAARLALGVPLETAVARGVAGVKAALSYTSSEDWAEMPIAAAIDRIIEAEPVSEGEALVAGAGTAS